MGRGEQPEMAVWMLSEEEKTKKAQEEDARKNRRAHEAARRQAVAEEAFLVADSSGNGTIDKKELVRLCITILEHEQQTNGEHESVDGARVAQFVDGEFDKADANSDGEIDFDGA